MVGLLFICDPAGIRTQDPRLKRPLLYQLSYGIVYFGVQKYIFFELFVFFGKIFLCFVKIDIPGTLKLKPEKMHVAKN